MSDLLVVVLVFTEPEQGRGAGNKLVDSKNKETSSKEGKGVSMNWFFSWV